MRSQPRCRVLCCALSLVACAQGERHAPTPGEGRAAAAPPRPADCREVPSSEPLATAIAQAQAGSALCLADGLHLGPAELSVPITLWGSSRAVLRSRGSGTTLIVRAKGAHVLGLTIDGSGRRLDTDDAAIRIVANDVVIEGVDVVHATFGILVERAQRVVLRGNTVHGPAEDPHGLRGDAIRLWETRDSLVEGNRIEDSRDLVVWYSSSNVLRGNVVERGRYGTHFMYSHNNLVEDNDYRGNVVGVFVMYSRGLRLIRNRVRDSRGGAGMGIGMKDSGNLLLAHNELSDVTTGLYFDTTPLDAAERDDIRDNRILRTDNAIVFHGLARSNYFERNVLAGNRAQVTVEGGGDAREAVFRGNYYDDYNGYDLDRDGTGDMPHEEHSLAADLTSERPELAFFTGSPALAIVEAIGELVPLFAPKTLMRDERPSTAPPEGAGHAG